MKVTTLQGINLRNPKTTIVYEGKNLKGDILEFIKGIHPVFMQDLVINKDKIEIVTNLPSVWKNREVVSVIDSYSREKLTKEKAKSLILELLNVLVYSMSTIPILHGAHNLGYETFHFFTNNSVVAKRKGLNRQFNIGIGKESVVTQSSGSTGDSKLGKNVQKDKWLTNSVLDLLELDIASWAPIYNEEDLPKVAKEIQFPMVIKPGGLTGGACVKVGIKDMEELKSAYKQVLVELKEKEEKKKTYKYQSYQKQILAQKMVSGKDYRILVVNGKVEIVTNRIPARVVGDGSHTVSELIEIENKDPRRDTSLPTHTLKPITIDNEAEKILKEQGLTVNDVPEKDKEVQIRKVASMSQGGITEDYTDRTHPQIKLICETIASTIHTHVLGIDVLANDISKPLTPENGCIIEVNTMPESYLNSFPVIGEQYPEIGEKIVRGLIPEGTHTNRVVFVGDFELKRMLEVTKENISETAKIGLYDKNSIYINEHLINDDVDVENGLLALKRNKSLDTIVIHYETENGIEKHGFGFDQIDLVVYDKNVSDKVVQKIKSYRDSKLISNIS